MCETTGNDNQSTDVILGWYHDMHVDHLLEDELLFELSIRQIVILDDPSFSRRRRSLRECLKSERENNKLLSIEIEIDVELEILNSQQKLAEIFNQVANGDKFVKAKGKSRLLHLSHKVCQFLNNTRDGDQRKRLNSLLLKCTDILKKYFYGSGSGSKENSGNGDDETEKDINPTHDSSKQIATNNVHLDPKFVDWISAMQDRIGELERQLAKKVSCRDNGTQTMVSQQSDGFTSGSFPSTQPYVNPQRSNLVLNTSIAHPYPVQCHHNPISASHCQTNITPCSVSQTATVTSLANSFSNGYLPNTHLVRQPFCPQHPGFATTASAANTLPNFSSSDYYAFGAVPRANFNPLPSFIPTPLPSTPQMNHSRRSLPVSKWSITKYNGEDQGLKLNEFLEIIQALALAEQTSEVELFESAIHLFSGAALKWYMTMRTSGLLLNWQHLVWELKRNFMHPDLDALIKKKIYRRCQTNKESFHEFYYEMEKLFRTMSVQLCEYEKLKILEQNMRLEYKKQLAFVNIVDLPSLVSAAKKVDALLYPAYSKVFEDEKSVHLIDANTKNKKSLSNQQTNQTPSSAKHTQRNSRNSLDLPETASNHSKTSYQNHQRTTSAVNQNRITVTLETLINSHRPPPHNQCYNCGNYGHPFKDCRMPRGVVCENCGFRGYPTNNCPYCIKNSLAASENRHSLNFPQ